MNAGVLYVLVAAASWGTWTLFLNPAHLPVAVSTPIMFLVMGVTALPWSLREAPPRWDRGARRALVANAICDAAQRRGVFRRARHDDGRDRGHQPLRCPDHRRARRAPDRGRDDARRTCGSARRAARPRRRARAVARARRRRGARRGARPRVGVRVRGQRVRRAATRREHRVGARSRLSLAARRRGAGAAIGLARVRPGVRAGCPGRRRREHDRRDVGNPVRRRA